MSWTANTTPLDGSAGLALATVDLGTGMVDTAIIESVDDWDNETFAYGTAVALKQNGTTVLYGKVTKVEPYAQGGGAQGRRYTISNAWDELEKVTYKQLFNYATGATTTEPKWRSKVWLGTDNTGARITTAQVIEAIVAYATDFAGVSMTVVLDGFGVIAPVTEATDTTCAALIMQQLRWHPNVQMYWRYTGDGATLHIKTLALLGTVSLTVSNAAVTDPQPLQANVYPRQDQVPPCVLVKYERINEFEDPDTGTLSLIELHEDKAGLGSEHTPGALCYTIELQGLKSTAVVQPVRCRTVPDVYSDDSVPTTPDDATQLKTAKWYQSHIAALKYLPGSNIRVDEHLKVFDTNEVTEDAPDLEDSPPPPPEGAPGDYPRELLEGTIQEWMTGIKATPMVARGKFAWKGSATGLSDDQLRIAKLVFGDALDQVKTFYVRYMATDARTQRYRTIAGFTAAEPWPTGLADAVYNEMSTVRHEGTVTVRGDDCYLAALPGTILSLAGQTGSGPVQKVSFDCATGKTTISFGWPQHLTPQDLFELQKASRSNAVTTYSSERKSAAKAAGGDSQSVQGALRGPIKDVQMPGGNSDSGFPFKVTEGSDSAHKKMQFGQVSGITPTIGGVPMSNDPAPECPITSGEAPYLKMNMTPTTANRGTTSAPDWWIVGGTVNTATIAAVSTPPTGTPATVDRVSGAVTDGEYYRQIAALSSGVWNNAIRFSLEASLCDDGSGNGNLSLGVAG